MFKKNIHFVILLILVFVVGIAAGLIFNRNTTISGNLSENDFYKDNYYNIKKILDEEFKIEGYEQIFDKNMSFTVAVPHEIAGRPELEEFGLYDRSVNYIYKNKNNGVIILLNLSANRFEYKDKEWLHSSGYDSENHNSPDNSYKNYYDEIFPNTSVFQYNFSGTGYNISIIAISDNLKDENGILSLNELARFTRDLNKAL